jgi:hypothetical protein
VLNVILGQHNKPKAAVHSAEMTGPLKKRKKLRYENNDKMNLKNSLGWHGLDQSG